MNIVRSAFKLKVLDCAGRKKKLFLTFKQKPLVLWQKGHIYIMLELEILFL